MKRCVTILLEINKNLMGIEDHIILCFNIGSICNQKLGGLHVIEPSRHMQKSPSGFPSPLVFFFVGDLYMIIVEESLNEYTPCHGAS